MGAKPVLLFLNAAIGRAPVNNPIAAFFMRSRMCRLISIFSLAIICVGCASSREAAPAPTAEMAAFRSDLSEPVEMPELDARVFPPLRWTIDPAVENSDRHTQIVWVSPSGGTAYGVI